MSAGGGRRAAVDVALVAALQAIGGLKSFLLLPVIARTLDAEAYGIWSQIAISVALLSAVAMLRLDSACIRYYAGALSARGSGASSALDTARRGYASALSLILLTLLALGCLAWAFQEPTAAAFFGDGVASHWTLLLWLKLASLVLLTFALSFFRARQRIRTFASVQLSVDLMGLAMVSYLLVVSGASLEVAVLALAGLEGLSAVVLLAAGTRWLRQVTSWTKPWLDGAELRRLLALAAPLVPYMLAVWVVNYVDRFVILDELGLALVGVYAAAYMIGNLAQFVVGPVNVVLYPLLAARWSAGQREGVARMTADTSRIYVALSVPLLLVLVVAAPPLLALLTGDEAFRVDPRLVLMVAAGVLLSGLDQLFRNVLILAERTRWFFVLIAPLALANLLLNLVWVPRYGLLGAAAATLVVLAAKALLFGVMAQRTLPLGLPWGDLGWIVGGGAGLSLGLLWVFGGAIGWLYLALTLSCYAALLVSAGVLRRVDPELTAALFGTASRGASRLVGHWLRRRRGGRDT